jgi:cytochrome oxidase Cu insertion factor (SCO1/SenC/PrrC family)
VMAAALDKIGPKAQDITPVLITIDPERDKPEQLAMYVKSFHPRLVGLTGSPEEIAAAAKAYRVYYKRVPDPKSSAGYTMDHSAFIYVMGPDGAFRTHFPYTVNVDAMADRLGKLLP